MCSISKYLIFISLITLISCKRDLVTEVVNDGIPPNIPVGLTVVFAVDGEVKIEWQRNNEAGIDGYNIYKAINDTMNFLKTGFTKDNFFYDDSLEYDTTYFYRVTATDIFGLESKPSIIVSAKPVNKYKPLRVREPEINARNWTDTIKIVLNWKPSGETDIKNYLIYRSDKPGFDISSKTLLDSSVSFTYSDTTNIKILKQYFYKIVAQDKGGLTSRSSAELTDKVLDKPLPVFPAPNDTVDYFGEFKIKTAGAAARYKLIVKTNPFTGTIFEKDFSSNLGHTQISVPASNLVMDTYKTYYWQIFTFTVNDFNPNSISELSKFTIIHKQ